MECDFCNKKNDDITVKSETHVSNKFTEKCYGCFKNVCYNCMEPFCDDCNTRTCKKCCYKHFEIMKKFLFFKILTFHGTFVIKT